MNKVGSNCAERGGASLSINCVLSTITLAQAAVQAHGVRVAGYARLARHMDPEVYGVGTIFLHLFYCCHVIGHARPDLANRSSW